MSQKTGLERRLAEEWKKRPSGFPGNGHVNYDARYQTISGYLERNIHKQVEKAAMKTAIDMAKNEAEPEKREEILSAIFLNDHGVDHISAVAARANDLIEIVNCRLTPYEVYILLVAIQFHDVGNLFGREGHESKLSEIMNAPEVLPLLGEYPAESRIIKQIATAHGGHVAGDPDTIGKLPKYDTILSSQVRVQLLAAILRLADELADDQMRASRFLVGETQLLDGSEIYHRYSSALQSVSLDSDQRIDLQFNLIAGDLSTTFRKGTESVFLLDEILKRTLKAYCETVYCMRFIQSAPPTKTKGRQSNGDSRIDPINTVKVSVRIYYDNKDHEPFEQFTYSFREAGYPRIGKESVYDICPELRTIRLLQRPEPQVISGELMKELANAERQRREQTAAR